MVSLEFFIDIILLAALWTLGSTQPVTEMSTRNTSWGLKTAGENLTTFMSLNLVEPSGPVQACNGIALPLPLPHTITVL